MRRVLAASEGRRSAQASRVATIAGSWRCRLVAAGRVRFARRDRAGRVAELLDDRAAFAGDGHRLLAAGELARRSRRPEKPVDVFYLYPTVWNRAEPVGLDYRCHRRPEDAKGAAFALQTQASAFDGVANVYAPYYRQAGSDVLNMTLQERDKIINGVPTADALAAFDYYITHFNAGRPFILAGHSQGSNLLVNVLSSYLSKHADVARRMVAAYVIGYSVTSDYLSRNPHLTFATRADDVGVIVSYNTQSPGMTGTNPVVEPGALASTRSTWTRTEDLAPAQSSLGSMMPQPTGRSPS